MQTEGRQKVDELAEEGCFRRRWPSIDVRDDNDLVPNPNVEQLRSKDETHYAYIYIYMHNVSMFEERTVNFRFEKVKKFFVLD